MLCTDSTIMCLMSLSLLSYVRHIHYDIQWEMCTFQELAFSSLTFLVNDMHNLRVTVNSFLTHSCKQVAIKISLCLFLSLSVCSLTLLTHYVISPNSALNMSSSVPDLLATEKYSRSALATSSPCLPLDNPTIPRTTCRQ